jgi:ATP-dependent DNA helicase DinG
VVARTQLKDMPDLPDAASGLVPVIRRLRLAAGELPGKFPRDAMLASAPFVEALDALTAAVDRLKTGFEALAERGEDVANLADRALDVAQRLARWRSPASSASDDESQEWIRWVDVSPGGWQLKASPLSVAPIFRRQLDASARAWIFTSATLAVGGDFAHYAGALGLDDASTGCWDSPFDYETQGLLCVPRDLPEPNTSAHTEAVVDAALPVIAAAGGRAFLLFTTLRALAVARERLADAFAQRGLDFPLLVQGEGSKTELLERFRRLGNAVLLGSASFWEGVDVAGPALSIVVIDKLPFAPPDDPLLAARLSRLKAQGGNPFRDYQLPQAAIALKQGAGRLIRSESDRGVLMICDPRLVDKPYGRLLWRSLPAMRRTRDVDDAVRFFVK